MRAAALMPKMIAIRITFIVMMPCSQWKPIALCWVFGHVGLDRNSARQSTVAVQPSRCRDAGCQLWLKQASALMSAKAHAYGCIQQALPRCNCCWTHHASHLAAAASALTVHIGGAVHHSCGVSVRPLDGLA